MIKQTLAISNNTYLESIRQPIFTVLTLLVILFMVLGLMISAYTMDDDNKLMTDMGLGFLFFFGFLLAIFTAAGVFNQEIENKTVLTVISKPVSRPSFVVGKFLGVTGAVTTFFWIGTIAFFMACRHKVMQTASDDFDIPVILFGIGGLILSFALAALGNYLYGWIFTSAVVKLLVVIESFALVLVLFISKEWTFQHPLTDVNPQLVIGLVMVLEMILIVTAVALTLATRMGLVMTLMFSIAFTALSLTSDNYLGIHAGDNKIFSVLYRLMPNLKAFWPADNLTQETMMPGYFLGDLTLYAGFIILAILSAAVLLFQRREVG
jgi:ABC-2 type transport system permease protein